MKNQEKMLESKKRLATKEEIKMIFDFFIKSMWDSSVLYSNSIGQKDVEKGCEVHYKETFQHLEKSIGSLILVDEFVLYDACIFTYSQMFIQKDNSHSSIIHSGRIFKINDTLEELDDSQDYIDFLEERVKRQNKSASKNKVGRPDKPKEESILKAHKVRIELLNSERNVDDVCKEVNIAKSTYYRVSKWIMDNTILNDFPL